MRSWCSCNLFDYKKEAGWSMIIRSIIGLTLGIDLLWNFFYNYKK